MSEGARERTEGLVYTYKSPDEREGEGVKVDGGKGMF